MHFYGNLKAVVGLLRFFINLSAELKFSGLQTALQIQIGAYQSNIISGESNRNATYIAYHRSVCWVAKWIVGPIMGGFYVLIQFIPGYTFSFIDWLWSNEMIQRNMCQRGAIKRQLIRFLPKFRGLWIMATGLVWVSKEFLINKSFVVN